MGFCSSHSLSLPGREELSAALRSCLACRWSTPSRPCRSLESKYPSDSFLPFFHLLSPSPSPLLPLLFPPFFHFPPPPPIKPLPTQLIPKKATLYRELFSLYTTTSTLSSPTRSLAIASFLDALTAALAVFSAPNNTSVYDYVATRVGADPAVVQAVWPEHKWTRAGAWRTEDVLPMMVEEEAVVAGEEGRTPMGRGEVEGVLDRRFIGGTR